jgi:hypothetical protein
MVNGKTVSFGTEDCVPFVISHPGENYSLFVRSSLSLQPIFVPRILTALIPDSHHGCIDGRASFYLQRQLKLCGSHPHCCSATNNRLNVVPNVRSVRCKDRGRGPKLSWKCRQHVATCRRRHNVSLQFWPDGSMLPTQNLRCRGSLCWLEPTFYQIFGIRM